MSRTRGNFVVPGASPPAVLATVAAFGQAREFFVMQTAPFQMVLTRGEETYQGKRTVVVSVFDGPQGPVVAIEAWTAVAFFGELDANPRTFVGAVPRRAMWKILKQMVEALGVPQAAMGFEHGV